MYIEDISIGNADTMVVALDPSDNECYELRTWSLKPLQRQEDTVHAPALSVALSYLFDRLGVKKVFAPHVAPASGRIVDTAHLTSDIHLGLGVLYRNPSLPADGVFLNAGETFMLSAAGCPIILASAKNHLAVAHAARDSLIERDAVMGNPKRQYLSIVDAMIAGFHHRGISAHEVTMLMMFSIPAESFEHDRNHATYGEYNRALSAFVSSRWPGGIFESEGKTLLDLGQVFVGQAFQAGAKARVICPLSDFPSFAHTRDGSDPERRNLILVKRVT